MSGGATASLLALTLPANSNSAPQCRHGHEWVRVVAADRFDSDSPRVVCQDCNLHARLAQNSEALPKKCPADPEGHHIHPFISPTDASFTVLDQLFKGRPINDRINVLNVLLAYVKGYLEGIGRSVNSRNPRIMEWLGVGDRTAAAMRAIGFTFNEEDGHYHPIDPTIIDPESSLSQRTRSLLALEELLVTEWNLKTGLGMSLSSDTTNVDPLAGQRLIFGWVGSDVAKPSSSTDPNLLAHYTRLGCLPSASDSTLQWAFLKQLDDDPASKSFYLDSLLEIAQSRPNSISLPEFIAIERTKRNLFPTHELHAAYALFNLLPPAVGDEKIPAHLLTSVFQARAEEQPMLLDELRVGLKMVAMDQGCEDVIEVYLDTGFAPMGSSGDMNVVADPNRPIGLENFGNICYLNALIQFYLTVTPLRDAVLHHLPALSSPTPNTNPQKFLRLLNQLFVQLSQKGGTVASVGIERDLAVAVLSGTVVSSPKKSPMKTDIDAMDVDDADPSHVSLNAQQDVGEFMDVFLDMTEKGFREFGDAKRAEMIHGLFFGKTIQKLMYLESSGAPRTDPVFDEFLYLMIDIAPDFYVSLDEYFQTVQVEYESRKALKTIKVESLPAVLTFQIRRVQYDIEKGCAVKSNEFLKFHDEIDMAKYLSPPHNLSPKRYRLHAVLQHEGEAGFGHYRIFIRNHPKASSATSSTNATADAAWFSYDDSRVRAIPQDQAEASVFRDTSGSLANAYCLMYVDAERVQEVVETFVRK
ncbi:ubiquitin-specific protease ubp2 [Podochytrium sp. JEL0797]|nr:ubiquitin-specific protease ubp2 [Podochytrium sp. JEL0797]